MVLAQHTMRIKEDAGKETLPTFAEDDLTAVQVAGKDEVVARGAEAPPPSRVVRTHDANIARHGRAGLGTGDRDAASASCEVRGAVMDPLRARSLHRAPDAVHPYPRIVVAAYGQNGRDAAERRHQFAQMRQLGGRVDEVAAEQDRVWTAVGRGIQDLTVQGVETSWPEMNVTDIEKAARIGGRREALLAHQERALESDLQCAGRP
jgi:hypothetical protein